MSNNSDNTKPQIRLEDYLPEVYKSDINKTLSEMAFNRHLSKDDTTRVSGFVGTGNPNAITNRQIQEVATDSHEQAQRQAFQLAPTMYSKVGTVERALSFRNFLTQLELQGVDISRLPLWANAEEFNWIPPINIDMLANYQNYFWLGTDAADLPQYFTIENQCNKATDKVTAYQLLMEQRGLHFVIVEVDFINNVFVLQGNWTNIFVPDFGFNTNVSNTVNLENKYWTTSTAVYTGATDKTRIAVVEPIAPTSPPVSPIVGQWWYDTGTLTLYVWDGIIWNISTDPITAQISLPALFPIISSSVANHTFTIAGKQDDLFTAGFVFATKDTNSVNLENKFWTTASVLYDESNYRTVVTTVEPFAITSEVAPIATIFGEWWYQPSTNMLHSWDGVSWVNINQFISGNISLSELLTVFQSSLNCACNHERGWDIGLWDDNSLGNVVWNTALLTKISHATEADWLAYNLADPDMVTAGVPNFLSLWYDTTYNQLKQYGDLDNPLPSDPSFAPSWNAVVQNFSVILDLTTAQENWEESADCVSLELNQWSLNNKWQHKSAVRSYANARRAQVPILEYDSNLELNKWTQVNYAWKYRPNVDTAFSSSAFAPSRLELEPIKGYQVESISGDIYVYLFDKFSTLNVNINLTDTFVPGYQFRITDDSNLSDVYTVEWSEYRKMDTSTNPALQGDYMVTVVKLQDQVFTSPTVGGPNNVRIVPIQTKAGDTWLGYHLHWVLDLTSTTTSPAAPQQWNIFKSDDALFGGVLEPVIGNPVYATFTPQVNEITRGITFQEIVVDLTSVTQIDLVNELTYNSSIATPYATPGSNELRVYVNGIRQYGTYTELTATDYPSYTIVNNSLAVAPYLISYVTGIVFDAALNVGDIVRLEVGPASLLDMGLHALPVRTVEDDAEFANLVTTADQPVYRSLTQYELNEQLKTRINQYPLFNVYDLITCEVILASPIITFRESSDSALNNSVQRRIIVTNNGTEFEFEQFLLDRDDNMLYGFRDITLTTVGQYWYNPIKNAVQYWDGHAWTMYILMDTVNGYAIRTPIVSSTEPTDLLTVDQTLWFNSATNVLYRRDVTTVSWVVITNVVINDADPTLRTIWRHGLTSQEYIPQYVDKDRNVVAVGSANADWEVVEQWIYNPEHRNKKIVKYSQLITHFRTIIEQQPPVPGLIGGGVYTKFQSEYDYGVGGTIKEYNGAFDTLISAINLVNVTPLGVIEFAGNEYTANVRFLRDVFNSSIIELFSQYSTNTLLNFTDYIVENVIATYEDNDYVATIYGDTTAYDESTDTGVRNWIATAPMFGIAPTYRPHLITDGEFTQVFHHDGHRTSVIYTTAEEDSLARKIISLPDTRVTNGKLGSSGASAPPATESAFTAAFGGAEVRAGVFWYQTSGSRTFYRFELYALSATHPSFYYNGVEIPNGTLYYNSVTHNVYKKDGLSWVAETIPGSTDISPLWKVIDFQELLGELYLEIENRLYARCANVTPVFDYSTLTPTPAEQAVYDDYYQRRFEEYVINYSVPTPYVNTQYRSADAFTWNYSISTVITPPRGSSVPNLTASWQSVYTNWYGTPYPHLEPWKLQGYTAKPLWWDEYYLETDGSRRWIYNHATTTGMWENIRIGVIPAPIVGKQIPTYPNGLNSVTGDPLTDSQPPIVTYDYFSVNIGDTAVSGYLPDQLLPPYFSSVDPILRSIYNNINQIIAPDADYVFGDVGPIEWQWTVSSGYPYDIAIIAFLMQPVRFMRAAFGPRYTHVDELEVDTLFKQVYSHTDALFHGDLYNTNQIYSINGLNQWYVNYNRYTGFDTSNEFRQLWTTWTPLLTYQFNNVIDTSTLDIANKRFSITDQDYNLLLTNSDIVKDLWIDAFNISVINIPPAIIQYNNQNKWKLELNALASIAREISYYDVKAYPFIVDPITDICYAYRYVIVAVDPASKRFYVTGNETDVFGPGTQLTVSGSTLNDGNFSVISSVYEPGTDTTRINVVEPVLSGVDGYINVATFAFPWSTGDMVVLSSAKILPAPLVPNTPYFVINTGNQTFKLAETFADALAVNAIDITSMGTSVHTVAEIQSSFVINGGNSHSKETWYHYALDKDTIRTITPPYSFNGMQNLINIIDGYAEYQRENGVIFNTADSGDFDPLTGRLVNWSLEVERFIDWAYGLRMARMATNDRFEYTANTADNTLSFVDNIPIWINGTAVQVSSTGSLPSPLIAGDTYYVYQTGTPGVIKLSISQDVSYSAFHVDLATSGSGHLYIAAQNKLRTYPQFEINPNRNNIWLDTPEGVLSNVTQGPYTDIRVRQTLFDQYGRIVDPSNILTFREDKRSRVSILPQLQNDVDAFFVNDPYNYIHLGGGHFFLEGYEHFVIFNPYTTGDVLIYDSFLGLFTTKFEMDFYQKSTRTARPTLGGFYLNNNTFRRNIEGAATDLQNLYDAYDSIEGSVTVQHARSLLGYKNNINYLDTLNVNAKSQFLFYRGMLHAKGSDASVMAYINSKRFVDAKLDEFWAVKLADFGDKRVKVYPEILLFEDDGIVDDIRLQFIGLEDDITDPITVDAVANKGFKLVTFADDSRWNNFPEQRAELIQPLFLDAKVSSLTKVFVSPSAPSRTQIAEIDYWCNTLTNTLLQWDGFSWILVENKIHITASHVFWRHNEACDDVRVVRRDATISNAANNILNGYSATNILVASNAFTVLTDITEHVYSGSSIVVTGTSGNDGTYTVADSWYDNFANLTYVVVGTPLALDTTGGLMSYVHTNFGIYESVHLKPATTGLDNYHKLNAELVRLDIAAFFDIIHIYTLRPSIEALNPAKLIDKKSDTVVNQISLWHPAYGMHYYNAIHNVDLQFSSDPATYSVTPNTVATNGHFWNFHEVGLVWLDTSQKEYIPYYDESIYPDIDDRLYKWGNLAPYADIKVYQWVQSNVAPSEWDNLAIAQQGDLTIPQNKRASGTAKTTLYKRERIISSGSVRFDDPAVVTITTNSVTDGQTIYVTSDTTLPEGLQDGAQYVVANASQTTPQTFTLQEVDTNAAVTIVPVSNQVSVVNVGTDIDQIMVFQSKVNAFAENDLIRFSTIVGGTLPGTLNTSTDYTVVDIEDIMDGDNVVFQTFRLNGVTIPDDDFGVGQISATIAQKSIDVVPLFDNNSWVKQEFTKQRVFGAWLSTAVDPVIYWSQEPSRPNWAVGDDVEVYLNGELFAQGTITYNTGLNRFEFATTGTGLLVQQYDYIDIVRPLHNITKEEADFDPDVDDDGVTTIQWKNDYEYSQSTIAFSTNGTPIVNYYFWVENTTTNTTVDVSSMTTYEVAQSLVTMPAPYFVVQKPLDASVQVAGYGYDQPPYGTVWSMGELPEFLNAIPVMYRQAIIRNVAQYVNDNDRYMLRFTRDLTLRDHMDTSIHQIDLKEKHEEWFLFRKNQLSNLPQFLWDKLIESLSGFSILDGSPVPSLDRILYDDTYGTQTQYGLETGQTFVNKSLGIATLLAYLQDPTRDFSPIDIDDFFARNDFTTVDGIVAALTEIYTSFSAEHVNGIWFEILQDALSLKTRYKGLMKTSWIALHGIRVLEVGGLFDE